MVHNTNIAQDMPQLEDVFLFAVGIDVGSCSWITCGVRTCSLEICVDTSCRQELTMELVGLRSYSLMPSLLAAIVLGCDPGDAISIFLVWCA